ncbi:hypothetical protein [Athalassotoga saccharophila]|uniref:hypothetical protein n=1 Tax=Athalassotoga saccharophila TaxID=1441386 RepID=UPI0013798D5E|nr:hypothetical protein [Athalassotoga saccharophila]
MRKYMIAGMAGFITLGVLMIIYHDYMNAFVSITVTFIFIFGLTENSSKTALAHLLSGNIIGMIFNVYYMISVLANAFDTLINDGKFEFTPVITFLITVIVLFFNVVSFFKFRDQFKKKDGIIK